MENTTVKKKSAFMRFLDGVERVGNKMPEPMTLFLVLAIAVLIIAHIGSIFGWSATGMMYNATSGAVEEQTIKVTSLLTLSLIHIY